jgi:hypothetical protein
MLSLESIEQRLENPKAYYVFYEFFYKAAVGEVRWKQCMDESEERIGNDTTEAFALLLFANNYKAWLYDEKLNHGDALWTEYDRASIGKVSVVDKLLVTQEFVLEENTEAKLMVVSDTTKQSYKKAVKARKDWLAEFRGQPVCVEMTGIWALTAAAEEVSENGPNAQEQPANKKERDKKRRKLKKGLKQWTGTAMEGERKFKGWSDNGHKAFVKCTKSIKEDVTSGKYTLWERAFREVHERLEETKRTTEDQPAAMKHTVDRDLVWEL